MKRFIEARGGSIDICSELGKGTGVTINWVARPQAKPIPIIAVSANSMVADVECSLDAGMTDHICKPIDGAVLVKKLK